ncbi:hypothetical protein GCM10028808_72950 [Spirosoma migulaei]
MLKRFTILALAVLLCPFLCSAQIGGKKVFEPITVSGYTVAIGDTLYFGQGTMPSGSFKYVARAANFLLGTPEYHLDRNYSGRFLTVLELRDLKRQGAGQKYLAIILPRGSLNFAVELEDAIKTGELTAINQQKVFNPSTAAVTTKPVASVADELIKLKGLLDAGALTQAEYDDQKKKLLNQ